MFDPDPCPAEPPDEDGVALAEALAALPVGELTAEALAQAAAGWQRVVSWAQAELAQVLAELARRDEMQPFPGSGHTSVSPVTITAAEVAARLTITSRQAENLVGEAKQLTEGFPATWEALRAGDIDQRRAQVILDELAGLDASARGLAETTALEVASAVDGTTLRRRVKRIAHTASPVGAVERCRRARAERRVTVTPTADGMAWLEAYLPGEDAQAVWTVLDAAAVAAKQDDQACGRPARTADQRRADALAQLAWTSLAQHNRASPATEGGATGPVMARGARHAAEWPMKPPPMSTSTPRDGQASPEEVSGAVVAAWPAIRLGSAQGRPVTVHVTVPLPTLAGVAELPGEVHGYGPVPASSARALAAAGVWQWIGTHPASGQLLDFGLSRYRPTRSLVDFLIARDRTCRAPGCHRPAARCDVDHARPFHQGGHTSADNCVMLCRTHHLMKHHSRWSIRPGRARETDRDVEHRDVEHRDVEHHDVEHHDVEHHGSASSGHRPGGNGSGGSGGHAWISPTGREHHRPPEPMGPCAGDASSVPTEDSGPARPMDADHDPPPF